MTLPTAPGDTGTIRYSKTFQKGITVPPHTIEVFSEGVRFTFAPTLSGICNCYSVCGAEVNHGLCTDANEYIFEIDSDSLEAGKPVSQNVTFEDALGNETTVAATSLHLVSPPAPTVSKSGNTVTVLTNTSGETPGNLLSYIDEFLVQRYIGTDNNYRTWKDWRDPDEGLSIDDENLIENRMYGYRVKIRTVSGSESLWSSWASIYVD